MTTLLKPILLRLRTENFASTSFSDESVQVSESEAESIQNISATVQLFRSLAFVVHPDKSVLALTQKIISVPRSGNRLQTNVTLTKERADNLLCCKSVVKAKQISQRIGYGHWKTGGKFSGREVLAIT